MRAVDTNILVRLLTRDDPAQVLKAEAFVENGAWVSQLVLAETLWALDSVYGLNAKAIAISVEMLLSHRKLMLQEPEVIEAALGHFRVRPALGFSDCLVLEIARKAGQLPLGTFDRGLAKLEGATRI
ncbi:MAG: PIN domain-containing protein [Panacagrimonas sp.]